MNTEKKFKKSLFIFRRDLRLHDNIGLNNALKNSACVIACFIFDKRQVDDANPYRSSHALQFMLESLEDLNQQLHAKKTRLYIFYGIAEKIVEKLILQEKIDAVFFNRDYTPFAIKRDDAINKVCAKNKCSLFISPDALLHEPESILKKDGKPYTIFTPFYKKSLNLAVADPEHLSKGHFYDHTIAHTESLEHMYKVILPHHNPHIACHGGSSQAHKILESLEQFKNYLQTRDVPAKNTTHLSAHLKFGTISIRQTHQAIASALGKHHPLLRQLYWRDFFTHIAFHFPHVFGQAFDKRYNKLTWNHNQKLFKAWSNGTTGFPIVDAGMRELIATGFMHNRVRMITASFLIKDLHIDWQKGEQFFAQQLSDYDPAVNNGNWQWVASTGADHQPYFRIFNPWLQQKKFDPECIYIKKWVPELAKIPTKMIHTWFKQTGSKDYPAPCVDHATQAEYAKLMYKNKK